MPAGLPAPAVGGFTTRSAGVGTAPYAGANLALNVGDQPDRVRHHRRRLAAAAGLAVDALVFAEQVHGRGVAVVQGPTREAVRGVDALVSTAPGLGLVVLSADCLAVLLADPVAGVVAAVHAGRQGLVAGVLQETVSVMAELGATAAGTTAVLGPSVCGRCYEVPVDLADEVEAAVPGTRTTTRRGTASVDLTAGATAVLRHCGVPAIRRVGGCTLEQPDRLYSYRRDGVTGRHGALVHLA